jgi:microcystin-dependent protein
MANPYVGEIRLFGGNFAPQGWMFCDGSVLPIAENETLFNLIGTTYGGDGQQTFALPDLRGRVPVHQSAGFVIGQVAGVETVTLNAASTPRHTHVLRGSSAAATGGVPGNAVLAATTVASYGPGPATVPMANAAVTPQGGSAPHENMAPFGAVSYIISLFGIFPSQT